MSIMDDWFEDSEYTEYYVGPTITDEMIRNAESSLGYKLPQSYINLLSRKNGGAPRLSCYPTQVPTGWAEDHIQVAGIFGIGGERGIDNELGSRYLIAEWGYPETGIVIGDTPSGGHEAIMLDYSLCGSDGEPRVIYVNTEPDDTHPSVVVLADTFELFLQNFSSCEDFEQ